MSDLARDRLAGGVLLLIAAVWIAVVLGTFPPSFGGATSPSTFPLASGIILAVLSAMMIAATFLRKADGAEKTADVSIDAIEWRGILATFGFLILYMVLLKYVGFILGTLIALTGFLYFVLGKRSPWLLLGYPAGFAFGAWLVLGKLMAVYLPRGELINLF